MRHVPVGDEDERADRVWHGGRAGLGAFADGADAERGAVGNGLLDHRQIALFKDAQRLHPAGEDDGIERE